ncbi:hypothetical protein HZR00_17250 [Elizabethkingia anophelis]|nr:hypothetical protein [Elizabethkingia anophelis]
MFKDHERNLKLFNSPAEIGLRCLFLLKEFNDTSLSIDKLIYFDYFLIHAGDISSKQNSIHPKYPFRSSEIVVKREPLNAALKHMISKELIEIEYLKTGFFFKISNIGIKVLDYFESEYASQLKRTSKWIYNNYKDHSEEQLQSFFKKNMKKWGGEFINESKFR